MPGQNTNGFSDGNSSSNARQTRSWEAARCQRELKEYCDPAVSLPGFVGLVGFNGFGPAWYECAGP